MSVMQEQRGGQRSAAYRKAQFWQPKIATRQTDDGVIYIEQQLELPPYPDRITDVLLEQAEKTPERTLFAERGDDGEWRRLSYAGAVDGISRLGQ